MKLKSVFQKLGDQLLTFIVWVNLLIFILLGLVIFFIYSLFAIFSLANIFLVIYIFVSLILLALGIKIKIYGTVDAKKGPYIFVFNHSSFIDMFVSIYVVVRLMGWKNAFSIIVAEKLLYYSIIIPIIRIFLNTCVPFNENYKNKTHARKVDYLKNIYNIIFNFIRDGKSFVIFPEGRRILHSDRRADVSMLPLKGGVLRIATQTEVDVVVVYIDGAFEFKPRYGQWWFSYFERRKKKKSSKIKVYVSEPISSLGKTKRELYRSIKLNFLHLMAEAKNN